MTDWYGLDANGNQIQCTHAAAVDWAERNDKQVTVGWGTAFQTESGARYIRGINPEAARRVGWEDIAVMMESFTRENDNAKVPREASGG